MVKLADSIGNSDNPPVIVQPDFNESAAGRAISLDRKPDLKLKAYLGRYYKEKAAYVQKFFEQHDCKISWAMFEILLEKKYKGLRKDKITPDIAHEIDQLYSKITSLEQGILKGRWKDIEKRHGSLDIFFAATIGHDLGEDKDFFPESLELAINMKLQRKYGNEHTHHPDIPIVVEMVENLTHLRKMSLTRFGKVTGQRLIVKNIPPGQKGRIYGFEDIFAKKMHRLSAANDNDSSINMLSYVEKDKNGKSTVYVTAYGHKDESAVDWVRYLNVISEDIYTFMVKADDRINGLASRIDVPESVEDYEEYLSASEHLFKQIDHFEKIANENHDSPLLPYIRSQKQMLGLLIKLGRMVVEYHPDRRPSGNKKYDASALRSKHGELSRINISKFFKHGGLKAYEHMDSTSHPLVVFFRQLGQHIDRIQDPNLMHLYAEMGKAVSQFGGVELHEKLTSDYALSKFKHYFYYVDPKEHITPEVK